MRFILISCLVFLITACSKPYEKYIGYWQLDNSKILKVAEISKSDNTYLITDNILAPNNTPYAMQEKDNTLFINNGMTNMPVTLSNDSTLIILDNKYTKISQAEFDKLKEVIKSCESTKNEQIKLRDANPSDKRNIDKKYDELISKIPYCKKNIFW